jgi:hypothetical protein
MIENFSPAFGNDGGVFRLQRHRLAHCAKDLPSGTAKHPAFERYALRIKLVYTSGLGHVHRPIDDAVCRSACRSDFSRDKAQKTLP